MAEPVLAAMGGAACEKQSWSPEILSFFGDPETVINKLGAVEADLSDSAGVCIDLANKLILQKSRSMKGRGQEE